jgi:steroid delta-isomerase-like uncharacterized protein
MAMSRADIAALVDRCHAAFTRHDVPALIAEHAEDCVMDSPSAGGVVTGREAIANLYEMWFRAFPDLTLTQEEPLIDGDRFAVRYILSGADIGGVLGLPPTRKQFRVPMVWLCTTRNGLLVHSQPVYDYASVLIQLGLLKAKPT